MARLMGEKCENDDQSDQTIRMVDSCPEQRIGTKHDNPEYRRIRAVLP
jgi:hypothetical protein